MVIDFIQQIGVPRTENKYLHFARIDKVESLEEIEGVVFLANPDMLSGLTTWAFMIITQQIASFLPLVPAVVL